jgi:hypothetical protein
LYEKVWGGGAQSAVGETHLPFSLFFSQTPPHARAHSPTHSLTDPTPTITTFFTRQPSTKHPTTTTHGHTQLPPALHKAALALDIVMRRPGSQHRILYVRARVCV